MKIDYTIDENDFLIYQLFTASKSPKITKTRKMSKFRLPIFLIIIGVLFYFLTQIWYYLIFCSIFGLFWLLLFPKWEKNYYKKYFQIYIQENFSNIFGKTITLELTNDFLFSKEKGYENKIMTSELKEITEIPSLILIKLSNGQSLIIPKNQIPDIKLLKSHLQELASYINIDYIVNDKWKWR
ncbi:YcxB family protein [Apibacter raozihei]|uniref:YcxB family protein n=1 Tax=Apibacter raozihei TaxID=2500547 RepID=UPI000FE2D78A|nr:YcxB family protein [Apibacter raozihei]